MNQDLWTRRFARLKALGFLAVFGLVLMGIGMLTNITILAVGLIVGGPGLIYICVLTILHWKDRYRGQYSDLWGALILIETFGWLKIVYLFRHLIPDARHVGRYAADSLRGG
jgi:hypothetical protein